MRSSTVSKTISMKAWVVITKKLKVKGLWSFQDNAEWLVMNSTIKTKEDAIIYFLGSYSWFKRKHIIKVKKIKL